MHAQLAQEWTTLQNNHESHERSALVIKLVAVALFALAALDPLEMAALVLLLWLQEAVLKTWQSRLADRLVHVETLLAGTGNGAMQACQLHSPWRAQRPDMAGLLTQYGRSAMRPTVAFPYAPLLLISALL
jgi:hypothetical protein